MARIAKKISSFLGRVIGQMNALFTPALRPVRAEARDWRWRRNTHVRRPARKRRL